jgi:hypothetical protein
MKELKGVGRDSRIALTRVKSQQPLLANFNAGFRSL